ncbi:hypothetical protein [Mastigocoleus testarum]|uniref:Uncharacterized protein n=1 Tax=Mastigocoleus testarum BC008 TaxID=371196 RepID=A0A0V7ZRY2_9CYAN|nr:hypothetical protein [Mastigocoleus testarum]KST67373.1 hypothetical protein BC008_29700 [Mastigocoleus testarum BC008]
MNIFANFIRSLLLSMVFSFVAPMLFVGSLWTVIILVSYFPGLQELTQVIAQDISQFLMVFGSGTPLQGVLVICLTCCFVGALFDAYAFYRCQILRLNS